jgi:hypothetical protein
MPIQDDTPTNAGAPVLSRTAIGQRFQGVTCLMPKSRDRLKNGEPIMNNRGKPSQELVVTLLTIGSTMPVGKVGEHRIPGEGEVVRAILKGKAYGDWIDASNALGVKPGVGYIVTLDTTHAQAYDESGHAMGGEIKTQAEADLVPRGRSLGYYGPLTIHAPATPAEIAWDTKACQFYNDSLRPATEAAGGGYGGHDDLEPAF